jgi:hypothetical protein
MRKTKAATPVGRDGFALFAVNDRGYRVCYLFATVLGAGLFSSICALTLWICVACSFELRRENLHPFLLQSDCRFQLSDTGLLFLDFLLLFQELQRLETHGRVVTACQVVRKGSLPQGHVLVARGVEDKGIFTYRRAEIAVILSQCP